MKTKIILSLAGLIILAAIIWGLIYFIPKIHLFGSFKDAVQTPGYYKVTRVSDGDTIEVNMDGNIERVRLIGIDTPETMEPDESVECYGQLASDFAHRLMDNQAVRLEADPINTNRDRYDRLLRYVYLKDGTFVNAEIIKQGYGFAYLSFPFTKADEFETYQNQARDAKRGVWDSDCEIYDQNGRLKTNDLTYLKDYLVNNFFKSVAINRVALLNNV